MTNQLIPVDDNDPRLGDECEDIVTKFKGTATSYHRYLNGCVRFTLESSKLGSDNKPIFETFDIQRLKIVRRGNWHNGIHSEPKSTLQMKSTKVAAVGGPQRNVPGRHTPLSR